MDGCGKINNRSSSLNIKSGDIILINSNQAHEIDAGGAAVQAMILQFSNHFLRDYYPNIQSLNFKRSDIRESRPVANDHLCCCGLRQHGAFF